MAGRGRCGSGSRNVQAWSVLRLRSCSLVRRRWWLHACCCYSSSSGSSSGRRAAVSSGWGSLIVVVDAAGGGCRRSVSASSLRLRLRLRWLDVLLGWRGCGGGGCVGLSSHPCAGRCCRRVVSIAALVSPLASALMRECTAGFGGSRAGSSSSSAIHSAGATAAAIGGAAAVHLRACSRPHDRRRGRLALLLDLEEEGLHLHCGRRSCWTWTIHGRLSRESK